MLEWPPSRRTLVQGLCLLPVLCAPLLGGTAQRPYTMVIAGLCGLAGLAATVEQRLSAAALGSFGGSEGRAANPAGPGGPDGAPGKSGQLYVSWFALALAVALLCTVLQLVPLPPAVRALVAPGSDQHLRQIMHGLGGYPQRYHPLSVDPSATLNETVRLGGYLCVLLGLGLAFPRRGESRGLVRAVCAAAGLIALAGFLTAIHVPLPAIINLGDLGQPGAAHLSRARFAAAFVNSNHQAALMAIGAILSLGLLLSAPGRFRVPLICLGLLLNAGLIGTLSRGGIAVGLLGQIVLLLWPRGPRGGGQRARLLIGLAAAAGAAVLCFTLLDEARVDVQARFAELGRADLTTPGSKVTAWVQVWPLVLGHLPGGVGRGAFEDAFQSVSSISGSIRFPYLENEWLQALVDFGAPAFVLLVLLGGAGMVAAARRLRRDLRRQHFSGHRVAAFVALCAVGLHNLVDFNLEVGGVALPVVVLCAVALRGRFTAPLWLLPALSAAVLIGAPLCARLCPGAEEQGVALRRLAAEQRTARAAVLELGRSAVLRHPLNSYLSALVGARLFNDRDPGSVDWVNRALTANPNDMLALRTSALLLAERGHPAQAQGILRYAITRANYAGRTALYQTALQIARRPADVVLALPDSGAIADEVLGLVASRQDMALSRAVAEWGLQRGAESAALWLATAALAQHDVDTAARWARALLDLPEPPGFLIGNIAGLLMEAGRLEEAEALCRKALAKGPSLDLALTLSLLRERRGTVAEARAWLEKALGLAHERQQQAQVHEAWASMEERQGNLHRAQQERQEAARLREGP